MLKLRITVEELYNEETGRFELEEREVWLEHSLLAISKWECIWEKAFFSKREKSYEEIVSYLQCMCLREEDEDFVRFLTEQKTEEITSYMERKMSAAWFWDNQDESKNGIITSEDIYYQMFGNGIPKECENWHIKRLMALIRTFQEKNNTKPMTRQQIIARNKALNAERRKKYNSKG